MLQGSSHQFTAHRMGHEMNLLHSSLPQASQELRQIRRKLTQLLSHLEERRDAACQGKIAAIFSFLLLNIAGHWLRLARFMPFMFHSSWFSVSYNSSTFRAVSIFAAWNPTLHLLARRTPKAAHLSQSYLKVPVDPNSIQKKPWK